jgi:uncharacterized protein YndB with AHSA1/START domain
MSRIVGVTTIARPPLEVFDYVTTPRNWPAWHPSSLSVTGPTDHPLDVGERCTEQYIVAGRRGVTDWFVRERDPGRRWVIEAQPAGGGSGTITYTLTPADGGTRFERRFDYEMPNAFLAMLDALVLRRRIAAEANEALRRLKAILESPRTGELRI